MSAALDALGPLTDAERAAVIARLPPDVRGRLIADACRESFRAFVRAAWPYAGTTEPLVWGWHLDAICDHLQAVEAGQIRRLLINIPPGHAKSKLVSVLFPAWVWTRNAAAQFLCATYARDFAERDSVFSRGLVESPWYRAAFMCGWQLKPDQNAKWYWANTREGHRLSIGVGGTGARADYEIIDDPISAVDVVSKAMRTACNDWIGQTLSTRFNDAKTGRAVMIMQRLHEEDPSAFVLAGGGWEHLCLPTEFEPARRCITYATRRVPENGVPAHDERREFWRDPRTESGELLFPAKFPVEALDRLKRPNELGETGFAGQHQQRPTPKGGGMFKVADWRFWKPDGTDGPNCPRPHGCFEGPARPLPARFDQVILSLDCNFKNKAGADPISLLALGRVRAETYILDRASGPLGFTRTLAALREMHPRIQLQYRDIRAVLVEAKANGDAIIESIVEEIPGVIPVEPEGGKEARAWAIQPQVQAGQVYLPDGASWVPEFIEQHAAFPKAAHDDDVDALSQGLAYFREPETVADILMRATFGAGPAA